MRWISKPLANTGHILYEKLDQRTFGVLSILREASKSFIEMRAPEAAAGIAYYALFSLFPLLLSMVALVGFFMENITFQAQVFTIVRLLIPVSSEAIINNMQEVLKARSSIGLIGIIGLVWSASAAFITLFRNINRAWIYAKPLSTLKSRLVAMGAVIFLGLLLILTLFFNAALDLVPLVDPVLGAQDPFYQSTQWLILSIVVPSVTAYLVFLSLYRWIPNTFVRWREAFWGALLAAVSLELTTAAFSWYLGSELAVYHLIYGSLGAIVALLTWIYLNSLIILFGAHLSAAIAHKTRHKPKEPQVAPPSPPNALPGKGV